MDNEFHTYSNSVCIENYSLSKPLFSFRDLMITPEPRPPAVTNSSRTINNGRASTLPPPSDYEMIIGLFFILNQFA
jgi:hypothetical protein